MNTMNTPLKKAVAWAAFCSGMALGSVLRVARIVDEESRNGMGQERVARNANRQINLEGNGYPVRTVGGTWIDPVPETIPRNDSNGDV